MRLFKHSAGILAILLLTMAMSQQPSNAQTKTELRAENQALREKVDSLMRVMDGLKSNRPVTSRPSPSGDINASTDRPGLTKEQADSIYAFWYMMGKEEDVEIENVETERFASDVPDSVYERRLKNMNCLIQIPYNDIVRNYIILYSQKHTKTVSKVLELGEFYFPLFYETFNRYGVPEEVAVLAIIESHFNPQARSRVGALGMWQFMYRTAKGYGLTINSFVDERMDVQKSADAAARFLSNAYEKFGDWNLAMSSYNCGAGNVRKAILRAGGKTAFWDIYPYLPAETRGYVPAFVGMLYALKYHKEHGIVPSNVADLPVHVDTFHIKKMLHFKQIEEVVGVPNDMLVRLNSQYFHQIIPGDQGTYVLRIPVEYTEKFIANESTIYEYKADELLNPLTIKKITETPPASTGGNKIYYTVKKGDTLGGIAAKYKVTVAQLQKWNNMGKKTTITIGKKLTIIR